MAAPRRPLVREIWVLEEEDKAGTVLGERKLEAVEDHNPREGAEARRRSQHRWAVEDPHSLRLEVEGTRNRCWVRLELGALVMAQGLHG